MTGRSQTLAKPVADEQPVPKPRPTSASRSSKPRTSKAKAKGEVAGDRKEAVNFVKQQLIRLRQHMQKQGSRFRRDVEELMPEDMWLAWVRCRQCKKWRHVPHHLIVNGKYACSAADTNGR